MLTPPSSSTGPVCFGTPVHTRTSTTRFFDTKHLSRDGIVRVMSLEMAPFFLGPMPPQDFLSTFLPSLQPSSFQAGMFDTLTNHRTETLMYKAFVSILTSYSILGTEKLFLDWRRATTPQDNSHSRYITIARQGHHRAFGFLLA